MLHHILARIIDTVRPLGEVLYARRRDIFKYGLIFTAVYLFLFITLRYVLPESWTRPLRPVTGVLFAPLGQGGVGDEIRLDVLNVKTLKLSPEQIRPSIEATGTIEFFEKVTIVSKSAGRIEKLYVREGQRVKKGQLLAQIEKLPLQLELRKAKAAMASSRSRLRLSTEKYQNARSGIEIKLKAIEKQTTQVRELKASLDKIRVTYDRKKKLYEQEGLSDEEFETLKTAVISREAKYLMARNDLEMSYVGYRDQDIRKKGLKVAGNSKTRREQIAGINTRIEKAELEVARSGVRSSEAQLHSLKILLKETSIRSPINGIVAARNKSVGEQVAGGAAGGEQGAIMVLVDIDRVYAGVNIREADLARIQEGLELEFKVDVYKNKKFSGKISIISPLIDPKTHTIGIKALVANPGHKLRPGMFIRANLLTGEAATTLRIPAKALLPREKNKAWAFVIKKNRVVKRAVTTGKQRGDRIEILSGLKSGEQIALEKLSQLREGLAVKPRPQNAKQNAAINETPASGADAN